MLGPPGLEFAIAMREVRGYKTQEQVAQEREAAARVALRRAAEIGRRVNAQAQAVAGRWHAEGRGYDCMIEVGKSRPGYPPRYKPKVEGWYLGSYATAGDFSFTQHVALDRRGGLWLGGFDRDRRALQTGRQHPEKTPHESLLSLLK